MNLLCKIIGHKLRTTSVKWLPPVPPKYRTPAYIQCRCMRCGKGDWWFRDNYRTATSYNPALHADYHAGWGA